MNQEDEICFIDSNIWLYALLQYQDTQKANIAKLTIQKSNKIIVSTQVINEVCVNFIKKYLYQKLKYKNSSVLFTPNVLML